MRKKRPKSQPRLIHHREIARLIGVGTEVIIDWVAAGEFPKPLAVVRRTYLYPVDLIEHWIQTGTWDSSAQFNRGLGKGRIPPNGDV